MATILSETSLYRQAIRGTLDIPSICESTHQPDPPGTTTPGKYDMRPHVYDRVSQAWCLVDSGAQLSIWPRTYYPRATKNARPCLKAVNGSPIDTYGIRTRKLRLGKLVIRHATIVADVKRPILGYDFLQDNEISLHVTKTQASLTNKRGQTA